MKERPIIFNAEMVRAILDGRKTMTRRVVKPQPPHSCWYVMNGAGTHALCGGPGGLWVPPTATSVDHRLPCPYGVPGDRLWAREGFALAREPEDGDSGKCRYRADNESKGRTHLVTDGDWKPSIFMPRWASRITLEIANVRVERLQDISVTGALSEGIKCPDCGYTLKDCQEQMDHAICINRWLAESKKDDVGNHPAIAAFYTLWDSINGKKHPSKNNPWVWVLEFKQVAK